MKKAIICIVGKSGSGKSMVAEVIEKYMGIELIRSYTTRPRRTHDESGHQFITDEEFDAIKKEDMIAFTEFGGARYCCVHKDLKDINLYIIDPHGLEYLKNNFSDRYIIYSILIKRPEEQRIDAVGRDRVDRDANKFYLPDSYYDVVFENNSGVKIDIILSVCKCVRDIQRAHAITSGIKQYWDAGTEYELRD
jgi:guanylate kinase